MRFSLIDKVVELQPGSQIVALKSLSLAEEYLADHFPRAPVIPGVFMLEGLTQAAAWLIRASENFAHSMVTLKEIRAVKFANFVEPGQTMRITAEITSQSETDTKLKAQGAVGDNVTVSAKLVLTRYNLADAEPSRAVNDAYAIEKLKSLFAILYRPDTVAA